jgi:hypothetical protein
MMILKLIQRTLLLVMLLSSRLVGAEQLPPPDVVGNAYDRDTGYFVYSEHHFCEEDQLLCTVQYRDSLGVIFAEKNLDYRKNLMSPLLVMTDYRSGVESRVPASEQENLVVDAGFDNFVRSIWDTLEAGGKAKFPFLVVGFDKPIKMKARRNSAGDCTAAELCLDIKLDSWFLGMIIDPIELSYSRAQRRLLRFSGISNIKDENGESLNVDIHYQYENGLLLVAPGGQQKNPDFNF